MPYGLEQEDLTALVKILASNGKVDQIVLFGSRAKGSFDPGSDIDISISGKGLDTRDIIDCKVQIDGTSLPYKVDLIIYEKITEPMLRNHIDRVGINLYKR